MQIVDAGGGAGRSSSSVIAERGVVKCPVATVVHQGVVSLRRKFSGILV